MLLFTRSDIKMNKIKYFIFISVIIIFHIELKSQDIEVSPVSLLFNAEPGETQTRLITVKNHGNKNTEILLSLQDFLIGKEGEREYLPANSTRNSIANWISISPSFINIPPNEEKTVSITLQAPIDDYSSKWGIVSVSTTTERTAYNAGENLTAGVGVLGRINVNLSYSPASNQNFKAKISNLKEITTEEDTVRVFTANIDNIGDKITECKVYLIAANLQTAEEKQFPPITVTAYPKSARLVELKLPDVLSKGKYSLSAILDFGSRSSLEGTQIIIDVP